MCPLKTTSIYWVFGDAKHCKGAAHIVHAGLPSNALSSFSTEEEASSTGTELYQVF